MAFGIGNIGGAIANAASAATAATANATANVATSVAETAAAYAAALLEERLAVTNKLLAAGEELLEYYDQVGASSEFLARTNYRI
ncbi:MAG: hypothetical protein LBN42_04760, partial [Oscillospiraceae bacterium]|nr:hypothetical protein [Oscillospiraceae bacterium]